MFPKFYTVFNYSSIAVVIIFLVLILTESIPREMYVTLLIITVIILVARVALRIYLHSYLKKSKGE
jgi:FlaA1/EpsC-like NDP-sugar epimerase